MPSHQQTVYLNGRYIARSDAVMDIEDRGTLFGDGVYEVLRFYSGRPLAMAEHVERLRASLRAVRIAEPAGLEQLPAISEQLVRANGLRDAKVYWQITRGSAPREHVLPTGLTPTLLAIAYAAPPLRDELRTLTAVTLPDVRWHFCSIKSLMLLPNVLALDDARKAGADAAILHRDGRVTEATAANVFVVRDGQLRTHPADQWILPGITRRILLELARTAGMDLREEACSVQELGTADEVFCSGTTTHVSAVTHVDGRRIGDAAAGPVTRRLHELFIGHIQRTCL